MAKISLKNFNWKSLVALAATLVIGLLGGGAVVTITNNGEDTTIDVSTIELAETDTEAQVKTEDGVIAVDLPTVESIDGGKVSDEPVGDRGWYVRTDTPQHFVDDTYGQCIDVDGAYGSQCVDSAKLFWENYAGYSATTCGYGSAKAMAYEDCRYENARDKFTIITDPTQLQPGDWIITDAGTWGHVNMAMGYYNNGYIAAYGTNQGGAACSGGGSASNIINFGLSHFVLAFRPNDYIVVEPEPTVEPIPLTGCYDWNVEQGDTMIGIGLVCENVLMNMEQVTEYAKTWWSQIYNKGHSVYWGWNNGTHYGLLAGDYLLHDVEGKFSE